MEGNHRLTEKQNNSISAGHQPKKKSTIDQQQSPPAHLQIKHLPQQQFTANNSSAAIDRRPLSNTTAVINTNTLPLANHHSVLNSPLQQKSSSSSAVHSLRMAAKSDTLTNTNSNVENLSPQKLLLGSGSGVASNGESGAVSKDSGDEDDPSSPFRRNSNNNNGNNTSEFSNLSVAGDTENKLAKKSKGKNILKRLFCCFSSSTTSITQRNYKTSDQIQQAGTQQGTSSLSKQPIGSSSNNHLNSGVSNNAGNNNSSYLMPQQHLQLQTELRDSNNNDSIIINIEKDEQSIVQSNNQNTTIKSDLVITSVERSINSPNSNNTIVATNSGSTMPARIINIAINNANMNSYYSNESFIPQNIPLGDIVDNFDFDYDYDEEEKYLLAPAHPSDQGRKCLVIDLDETLVHSSFKHVHNADFIVPVEIDGITHQVYVLKRPHVDEFLQRMGQLFECVLFTASLAKYADPVSDLLDKWGVFRARLFREACVYYRGNYVKDLSRLGRDLNKMVILDNSPASYIFHPDNAVPCTSWFDDIHDRELLDLIPFFERLAAADSVYSVLKQPTNHFHHPHMYQQQPSPLPSAVTHYNTDSSLSQSTPIASINPQVVPSSSPANSITSPTPTTNSIIYQVPQTPQYEDSNKVLMSIELNKQTSNNQ